MTARGAACSVGTWPASKLNGTWRRILLFTTTREVVAPSLTGSFGSSPSCMEDSVCGVVGMVMASFLASRTVSGRYLMSITHAP